MVAAFINTISERRIYVAVLADYNNGHLHGRWIDCDDIEDMETEVAALLRSSKFPNVMVDCPDCEGPAETRDLADPAYAPCETCKGKGKVPSAEEYAIHDHEGFGRLIGEYTPLTTVAEWAEVLDDATDPDALIAFASYNDDGDSYSPEEIADDFREAYLGKFDTLREWAEGWLEDTGGLNEVPEDLRGFIDLQHWGEAQERDWIFTIDAKPGIYVFRRDY